MPLDPMLFRKVPHDVFNLTTTDENGSADPVFWGLRQFAPNGDFQLLTIAARSAAPAFKTPFSYKPFMLGSKKQTQGQAE